MIGSRHRTRPWMVQLASWLVPQTKVLPYQEAASCLVSEKIVSLGEETLLLVLGLSVLGDMPGGEACRRLQLGALPMGLAACYLMEVVGPQMALLKDAELAW